MSYLKRHGTRRVPQWAPIPGTGQVPNSAGGFAWEVDDWARLRRFLILGSEGGSYYATEWTLTRENAQAVERCIHEGGTRAVAEIARVSEEGRAPKNDPALFALAMAAGLGDEPTRRAALEALPRVARTGTHLFQFATFVEQFRGWGRSLRRAVGGWYASRPVDALAYQAVKYRQRGGVTHRDLLRLAHPAGHVSAGNPSIEVSAAHAALFEWIVRAPPRTICRASSMASSPLRRPRRRSSRPDSCASTGSRARRSSPSTSPRPRCGMRCSRTCR
jgi:60 kDa SS-A/Ro ribonucleoprotein